MASGCRCTLICTRTSSASKPTLQDSPRSVSRFTSRKWTSGFPWTPTATQPPRTSQPRRRSIVRSPRSASLTPVAMRSKPGALQTSIPGWARQARRPGAQLYSLTETTPPSRRTKPSRKPSLPASRENAKASRARLRVLSGLSLRPLRLKAFAVVRKRVQADFHHRDKETQREFKALGFLCDSVVPNPVNPISPAAIMTFAGLERMVGRAPGRIVQTHANIGSGTTSEAGYRSPCRRHRPSVRNPAVAIVVRSTRLPESRQQPAASVLRRTVRADFPSFCRADLRAGAQFVKAVCGTKARRTGLKIPHTPGGHGTIAVVSARNHDVLVRLRTHESHHRSLVLAAGGGSARRHARRGIAAGNLRAAKCHRTGHRHRGFAGDSARFRDPQFFRGRRRIPAS